MTEPTTKLIRIDRTLLARLQAAFRNTTNAPKSSDVALVTWCLEDYVGIREDELFERRADAAKDAEK